MPDFFWGNPPKWHVLWSWSHTRTNGPHSMISVVTAIAVTSLEPGKKLSYFPWNIGCLIGILVMSSLKKCPQNWEVSSPLWVFPYMVVPPNHPLKNRVFHSFHHPFWDIPPIFGNTYNNSKQPRICSLLTNGQIWDSWLVQHKPQGKTSEEKCR